MLLWKWQKNDDDDDDDDDEEKGHSLKGDW